MEAIKSNDEIKKLLVKAMKKFDEICCENNLRYTVSYGTMLGAVRHKGFIPWDDDIDVVMPRDDYERLLSLKYNDGRYEVKSYRYSKNYHYIFSKLSDNSTYIHEENRDGQELGLYIDIFPADYISEKEYKRKYDKLDKKIPKLIKFYGQLGPNNNTPNSELSAKKIAAKYAHKALLPITNTVLRAYESRFIRSDGEYCIPYFHNFTGMKNSFRKEQWDNIIRVPFEDIEVMMLADYDEWLTGIFGDYMTPPPPEQQNNTHSFVAYYI